MNPSDKKDMTLLEQAYLSIYEAKSEEKEQKEEDESQDTVEEKQQEESEDDKMSAAVAIQQTADEVEDEGEEVPLSIQRARQESEKYVANKTKQFKGN